MSNTITIYFSDLSLEKQEDIQRLAREYLFNEYPQDEYEDEEDISYTDFINEKIDQTILNWGVEGRFKFNI